MRRLLFLLFLVSSLSCAQEKSESREMVGQLGNRSTLLVLHGAQRADGSWQMTGEYVLLGAMVRRYLEGERSPELGVTTLREGVTAILFGREPTGELRGTLREGIFKGTRFGPGGQERERFEFTEEFPAMDSYQALVHCEVGTAPDSARQGGGDARYASTLAYVAEGGRIKNIDWRSKVGTRGHQCVVASGAQQPLKGGLRWISGRCTVTLRDLGEYIKVSAENCSEFCGSDAYLETTLVDRRGQCRLLRPEAR